ncbi:hypothetical protein KSF78_0001162 [Schistosoma japonicum]|nr:hypothetical protein KSF78_0001162 [Schistosoma japonicum]
MMFDISTEVQKSTMTMDINTMAIRKFRRKQATAIFIDSWLSGSMDFSDYYHMVTDSDKLGNSTFCSTHRSELFRASVVLAEIIL